ncbi:MAG: VWA domain-containing protein, partial [Acidobacteriaceae bacterium]|nr:VWA domain-containing protein [Acidobacteriaceae bacterium]
MYYIAFALILLSVGSVYADDPVVFKSDVALGRVDAQVVDKDGRAITGLEQRDFVLRVDGRVTPIRNFASENMPIDILLLLDVSGSMEPHVERIASAARQALDVLAPQDRIAIMVFDTYTRVRLPFRDNRSEVADELNRLVRSERFNGGTHITRALLSAASYVEHEARPQARRAIVILTDDETQDSEDEPRVEKALARANAILSFLQAPYEPADLTGGPIGRHRTWGSGGGWPGGGWPGSGGGVGFPGGGPVVLGPGGPGVGSADPSHSAGTATIAGDSGGDTMQVDQASALEDTLARLRQRYTLNFYFPNGADDRSSVRIDLARQAAIRYRDAEVRSRRVFMASVAAGEHAGPTVVTRAQDTAAEGDSVTSDDGAATDTGTSRRRSVAVNEDS